MVIIIMRRRRRGSRRRRIYCNLATSEKISFMNIQDSDAKWNGRELDVFLIKGESQILRNYGYMKICLN